MEGKLLDANEQIEKMRISSAADQEAIAEAARAAEELEATTQAEIKRLRQELQAANDDLDATQKDLVCHVEQIRVLECEVLKLNSENDQQVAGLNARIAKLEEEVKMALTSGKTDAAAISKKVWSMILYTDLTGQNDTQHFLRCVKS